MTIHSIFFDVDGDGLVNIFLLTMVYCIFMIDNKSELFSREFGSSDLGGPINFIFSPSDRKIGVFDIIKN